MGTVPLFKCCKEGAAEQADEHTEDVDYGPSTSNTVKTLPKKLHDRRTAKPGEPLSLDSICVSAEPPGSHAASTQNNVMLHSLKTTSNDLHSTRNASARADVSKGTYGDDYYYYFSEDDFIEPGCLGSFLDYEGSFLDYEGSFLDYEDELDWITTAGENAGRDTKVESLSVQGVMPTVRAPLPPRDQPVLPPPEHQA